MNKIAPYIKYVKRNFDSLSIITVLATVASSDQLDELSDTDLTVLAALRRSNNSLTNANLDEVHAYLQGLNEDQIPGLVSNVKGILHEMEFVKVENEDGDSVYASFFKDTNHPDTDVQLFDEATGDAWDVQLKATSEGQYVQDWIDDHPGGEILVTQELADEMGLPSSGYENADLTSDVRDFVDEMISGDEDDQFWDYFPALTLASLSLIVWELWKRYKAGEISKPQFQKLASRATGLKATKFASLGVLLSIPVAGQITGAILVANLLLSARRLVLSSK